MHLKLHKKCTQKKTKQLTFNNNDKTKKEKKKGNQKRINLTLAATVGLETERSRYPNQLFKQANQAQ